MPPRAYTGESRHENLRYTIIDIFIAYHFFIPRLHASFEAACFAIIVHAQIAWHCALQQPFLMAACAVLTECMTLSLSLSLSEMWNLDPPSGGFI